MKAHTKSPLKSPLSPILLSNILSNSNAGSPNRQSSKAQTKSKKLQQIKEESSAPDWSLEIKIEERRFSELGSGGRSRRSSSRRSPFGNNDLGPALRARPGEGGGGGGGGGVAGITVADGSLNVLVNCVLTDVNDNIFLTPATGDALINGAFIGVRFDQIGSPRIFPVEKLEGLRFMCVFGFKMWWMTQRMGICGLFFRGIPTITWRSTSRVGILLWMDLKGVIWFLGLLDQIRSMSSPMRFANRLTHIKENHKFQKNGKEGHGEEDPAMGLRHIVAEIKDQHALKYVYVWHAITGYWGWYGIDGVKADVQNIPETLGVGHGRRVKLSRKYHQALEASISRNFPDNGIISCMSHKTNGLYRGSLGQKLSDALITAVLFTLRE
ncbi:galactinol--sucrose galactosyltransferase [Sarracenia purpurea var. burkii]